MKFSSSVLVSCFFFFIAAASAVDATLDDTSGGPGRPRRTLFGKKNPAAAAAAAAPAPSQELAVQGGPDCSITQQASTGKYTLSATVGKETVLFAERPVRTARKLSTEEFVDKFADIFFTSNPNAAVTFTSTTASADNNNNGPLIVVLSQTRMVSSSIIEYTMTQSESLVLGPWVCGTKACRPVAVTRSIENGMKGSHCYTITTLVQRLNN